MPFGAYTTPLMLVVPLLAQVCCWRQRPVQVVPAPHTFGPAAPHTSVPGQVPQLMTLLQVSVAMPQLKPCCAHVWGLQVGVPQTPFTLLPPQVIWLPVQVPQSCRPMQPSLCMPQVKPSCVQVFIMHDPPTPQTFGLWAPQVSPEGQVAPQAIVPPQPSPAMPQS